VSNQDNWIVVGRFGRPHGVKGSVTVHSFTEPPDNILRYPVWYAFINNQWQPIRLLQAEMQNKYIIAQIEGYPEREMVAQLTNVDIAVPQNQLEELEAGEYYWYQLIGMKVVNSEGDLFGEVTEILPTGSNDVLVVEGKKRHLIPYLPGQFILEINSKERLITVDWEMDF
jgi:16S rRNA processing protein RimM